MLEAAISDSRNAVALTLDLLQTLTDDKRLLRVHHDPEHPIEKLVLTFRKCDFRPNDKTKELVRALSMTPGMRSYSGESCMNGFYIGNNLWGRGFEKKSTYCPNCGYGMSGPEIDHVIIMASDDDDWNKRMIDQCEMGACWHEGSNVGMTYEFIKEGGFVASNPYLLGSGDA